MEQLHVTSTKDNEKVRKMITELLNANKEFQIMITVPSQEKEQEKAVSTEKKKEPQPERDLGMRRRLIDNYTAVFVVDDEFHIVTVLRV